MIISVAVDSKHTESLLIELRARTSAPGVRAFLKQVMHPYLVTKIGQRFQAQGDSASGKWVELAQATGMIRQAQGYSPWRPINIRSGGLLTSLVTSHYVRGDTLSIPGLMSWPLLQKLMTAQLGNSGDTNRRPAPPRPVLAVGGTEALFLVKSFDNWLQSGGVA